MKTNGSSSTKNTRWLAIAAASIAAMGAFGLSGGCGGDPTAVAGSEHDALNASPNPTGAGGGGSCETPNEGCRCTFHEEGLSAPCGVTKRKAGSEVECYEGLRTCSDGVWGSCEGLGTYATKTLSVPTGVSPLGLGASPSACADNPCDPYCKAYSDTPKGIDAGPKLTVTTDGGLTLVSAGSCQGAPNVDNDGDGWTEQQGDCNDCSAVVNPGAYDYPGNGFDDDCDGVIDNAPVSCDSGISLTTNDGDDFAQAMDLCRFTNANATGAAKTWGVINGTPKLVQANATSAPTSRQYGVMPYFGNSTYNGAKKGDRLAVFSSGTARYTGQSNFTTPKGGGNACGNSYSAGTSSSVPCGLSWNKAGCPAGTPGNNSSGVTFQVRVPTNAQCMSFRFHYISSEYPEWVCSAYNDVFIAMLKSGAMKSGTGCCGNAPNTNCNISYGSNFTPVSVNNNLFSVPGCTNCQSPVLAGTGFDGSCNGRIKGGSTGWLYSYAPVKPGEIATFHTSIWDTADQIYDSTVLIDSWEWYPGTCSIATTPSPPAQQPTPPVTNPYAPAVYTRDFQATCLPGERVSWRLFTWRSMEPSDSKIQMTVQTAPTLAELGAAPSSQLVTSSGAAVPKTRSADVGPALDSLSVDHERWLRVNLGFVGSTDGEDAPTMYDWKQAYDCVPAE